MADQTVDIAVRFKNTMSAGLKSASTAIKSFSAKSVKSFKLVTAALKKLKSMIFGIPGAMAAIAGIGFGHLVKEMSEAAKESEELENRFTVLFKDGREDIRLWSQSLAVGLGRGQESMKRAITNAKAFFETMQLGEEDTTKLSKAFVQVGLDLASFYDQQDDEALNLLRSGLIGNAEALDRFNVRIAARDVEEFGESLGIAAGDLSNQQKQLIRFRILIDRSRASLGDAERTSDQFAARMKYLQGVFEDVRIEVGRFVNVAILEGIEDAGGIQALRNSLKLFLTSVASGFKIVVTGVANMIRILNDEITRAGGIEQVVKRIIEASATAADKIGLMFARIRSEIQVLGSSRLMNFLLPESDMSRFERLRDELKSFEEDVLEMNTAIQHDILSGLTGEESLQKRGMIIDHDEMANLARAIESHEDFVEVMRDMELRQGELKSKFEAASAALTQQERIMLGLEEPTERAGDAIRSASDALGDTSDSANSTGDAVAQLTREFDDLDATLAGLFERLGGPADIPGMLKHFFEKGLAAVKENQAAVEALRQEAGQRSVEQERERNRKLYDLRMEAAARLREITREQYEEQLDRQRSAAEKALFIAERHEQRMDEMQRRKFDRHKRDLTALEQMSLDALNAAQVVDNMATTAAQAFASGLGQVFAQVATGAMSAKEAFKQFAASFIQQMLAMIMQAAVLALLMEAIVPGRAATAAKGFGAMSGFAKAMFMGMSFNADGGIVQGSTGAWEGIPGYASGGVVTKPHIAMVGEGSMNEAIVPLPNGRSIPVQNLGGGGDVANITFEITTNDARGFDTLLNERRRTIEGVVSNAMQSRRTFRTAMQGGMA